MPLDIDKAIQELCLELFRVEAALASLEALARASATTKTASKRGRKSMSAEERRAVSERMMKYWAARRAVRTASAQV